jgi:non-heme chloroperoxidase
MSGCQPERAVAIRSVRLQGGVTLQYAEQGKRSGAPVLFLHGYTDSWRSFESVFEYLPTSLRAIALSQRGHGDSERPATGYRAHDFAADLSAFMDALGIERAVLVGHSMGTQVAQRFAIEHPARAQALVLVAGYVSMRSNPVVQDLWASSVSRLTDPVDPSFVLDFQKSTLAQPIPQHRLEMVVAESLKVPARVWRDACAGFLEDDLTSDLHRIMADTLLLWGDKDEICTRTDQDALRAGITNSRLVVHRSAGHGLHWEEPARVAAEIATFVSASLSGLSRVPTSRSAASTSA